MFVIHLKIVLRLFLYVKLSHSVLIEKTISGSDSLYVYGFHTSDSN